MTPGKSHNTLPCASGVSLKSQHFAYILEHKPDLGFFEIHPENYMSPGGLHLKYLDRIRQHYPLSMHGVGLSLGSADGIKEEHLKQLVQVVKRFEPAQVSEHLAWSHWNEVFLNDLLPLPYTEESLNIVSENIERVQEALQRNILIENPSIYIDFSRHDFSEPEFLTALCKKTGCALLLDLNNIVVSAFNNSFSARDYLEDIPVEYLAEVHLAGHSEKSLLADKKIRIDDHGSHVSDEVWRLAEALFAHAQKALPLLVEWDTDIPEFSVLHAEASKAQTLMRRCLSKQQTQQMQQAKVC